MKPKSVRMTSTEKEPRSTKSPLNICGWFRKKKKKTLFPLFPTPPRHVPSAGGGYVGVGLGGQPVELEDVQQVVVLPVGVPAHRQLLRLRSGSNVTTQNLEGGGNLQMAPPPPNKVVPAPGEGGTHLLQRRFYQGGQLGQHLLHLHQDLLGQTGSGDRGDTQRGTCGTPGTGLSPPRGLGGGLGEVGHLVGAFSVEFLLLLVPLHQVLHESQRDFAILQLGAAVLVLDGCKTRPPPKPPPAAGDTRGQRGQVGVLAGTPRPS